MGAQNWPQYRNPNDTINPITRRRPCYDATCCSVPHYCVVAVLDGEKGPSDGGFSLSNRGEGSFTLRGIDGKAQALRVERR